MHNVTKKIFPRSRTLYVRSCSSNTILILPLKEEEYKMAKVWAHHRHQGVLRRSPSACLPPLSSPFSFFFILLTKKSISHRWNFSAFPYKRSPMKIYMRSFRRWFIPKIRSIKWKILFILFLSLLSAAHFLNFSKNLGSFPLLFLLLFFFNSIDQPLIYNNLLVSWDRLKA